MQNVIVQPFVTTMFNYMVMTVDITLKYFLIRSLTNLS